MDESEKGRDDSSRYNSGNRLPSFEPTEIFVCLKVM